MRITVYYESPLSNSVEITEGTSLYRHKTYSLDEYKGRIYEIMDRIDADFPSISEKKFLTILEYFRHCKERADGSVV